MKNILHVGCGGQDIRSMPSYFQDGAWSEIRFDIDPNANPDIQGELQDLSLIEDACIDVVYSSHNIEHVSAFEVSMVLKGFRRVLKDDGFALILCPDIQSVAQAMLAGHLEEPLYHSSAGPINALDIVYGHQKAIQQGQVYMAHKTAFTAETLAKHLLNSGFSQVCVVRDVVFGLHAIAFVSMPDEAGLNKLAEALFPARENIVQSLIFPGINVVSDI